MRYGARMNLQWMIGLGIVACVALAGGCSKDESKSPSNTDDGKLSATDGESKTGTSGKLDEGEGAAKKAERPEEVLLDAPVERRLYSDRIEASSFAWGNYNRFHENYHPNYLMDGDPVTTWLEDADGNGIGEWVRIATSPITGSTKLRLRMQNGYHKSKSLFKKNSRVKSMELKVLPDGPTKTFEVADSMEWQELEMDFDSMTVEGIELKMLEAYGGTKYEDLCISDVELYVTGLTPENPAFEAKKLAQVTAWKDSRLAAAKMFENAAANELPIKSGYTVVKGERIERIKAEGRYEAGKAMLALLKEHAPGNDVLIAQAQASLASKFKGWKHYRPVIKNAITLPDVDGLVSFREDRSAYGWRSDVFELPAMKNGKSLAQNQRVALFDAKKQTFTPGDECKKGRVHALRPGEATGPNAAEMVIWRCHEEEEREGVYRYMSWELLEYDDKGWVRVAVGPQSAHVFNWEKSETGIVLASATRVSRWGNRVEHLSSDDEKAKQKRKE